ncbi:MAG: thioesterase family protein [Actinophytocola sp.]|nr:thioesterase family protein [Actinophytocola sp.]
MTVPEADAFYVPVDDETFSSTRHTAGPWNAESQHLGPPSALLARALERIPTDRPTQIARVTVEILGPVPVAELRASARLVRPGRSVEMLAAELTAGERVVATASAWRIARSDSTSVAAGAANRLPSGEGIEPMGRPDGWSPGYVDAMEWRPLVGGLHLPGPSTAWVRQRVPLVAGENPTGLQRLLTVADSGNGLSNRLNPSQWWFINTDLTVHIMREPVGEWIGLDAHTVIGPDGIGTASSVLHDQDGQVAIGAQALMVRPR